MRTGARIQHHRVVTPFLHIFDDVLDQPDLFRRKALGLTYRLQGPYPGRNSVEQIEIPGIERFVSQAVGEAVRAMPPPGSHAHCRLSLAADAAEARIHVDPSHWTGVLYLSPQDDGAGGTNFFRHRRTGTERLPRSLDELSALGFDSFEQFQREVIDGDGDQRDRWELTTTVTSRYNRLVLLQPQYWHTAGRGFGASVSDGRLVYLMFFRRLGS